MLKVGAPLPPLFLRQTEYYIMVDNLIYAVCKSDESKKDT